MHINRRSSIREAKNNPMKPSFGVKSLDELLQERTAEQKGCTADTAVPSVMTTNLPTVVGIKRLREEVTTGAQAQPKQKQSKPSPESVQPLNAEQTLEFDGMDLVYPEEQGTHDDAPHDDELLKELLGE